METLNAAPLTDEIKKFLDTVEILPPSPAVLPKLAKALANIETDVQEVVDVIRFDPSLTAKLLQICNSAYFGRTEPVVNVEDAIAQIGYDVVFLAASAISAANCLHTSPTTDLDAGLLWKHSVITAFGTQYIAKSAGLDGSLLFTAGLLHDLGKVVLAEAHGPDYTRLLDPIKRGPSPLVEVEIARYGFSHADVGACLLERWKLPAPLVASVRFHHNPAGAGGECRLAACVCGGNLLAFSLENPLFALDPANPELKATLEILNLTTDDMAAHSELIRNNWEFVQRLCQLWV
jgi:putative nucleotidyltransferase with HDIG domain